MCTTPQTRRRKRPCASYRLVPATKQPSKGRFLWVLGSNPPLQEKAEKPSSISSDGSGGSSGIIVIDPLCLRRGRRDSPQAASDPTEDATASAPMRYEWSAAISTASALADVAPMGSVSQDVVRIERASASNVATDTVAAHAVAALPGSIPPDVPCVSECLVRRLSFPLTGAGLAVGPSG